jgi:hypothetical protein
MNHISPTRLLTTFNCPHCDEQTHHTPLEHEQTASANDALYIQPVHVTQCFSCHEICVWYYDSLVYPHKGNAPHPSEHMPDSVKADYKEAASIFSLSPRGAAAILRLAIQKLCLELGQTGENLSQDIHDLVMRGLPDYIEQSLDLARVVGEKAVRPGQIVTDNAMVAGALFTLLNAMSDTLIKS